MYNSFVNIPSSAHGIVQVFTLSSRRIVLHVVTVQLLKFRAEEAPSFRGGGGCNQGMACKHTDMPSISLARPPFASS